MTRDIPPHMTRLLKSGETVTLKPVVANHIGYTSGVVDEDQHPRGKSVKVLVADLTVFQVHRGYVIPDNKEG